MRYFARPTVRADDPQKSKTHSELDEANLIKAGLTIDPVVVSASLERFIRDQVESFQREGAILGMRGGGVDNGEWIMGDREKRVMRRE